MRKYLFLSIIIGLLSIVSCEDNLDINKPQPFNEPNSEVKVYTEKEVSHVSAVPSENTITFNSNAPNEIIPQVGEIIQMPVSEKTPYGFLGKVTSVQRNGDVVVTTEEVALDEAYPNLSIDTVFDVLGDIEGVFDEEGNPIEYTIEEVSDSTQSRAVGEFDWQNKKLTIPIPSDFLGEDISVSGSMSISFAGSKFDLDNKDALKYLNLELKPSISVGASIKTSIKSGKKEFATKPIKIKARAVVGPVIIPITIPISFKAGVNGEFSSTLQLNYTKACNAYMSYKDGVWDYGCKPITNNDESPWGVSSFDVNGTMYSGVDVEFIAGVYTRNAGIGFEVFPNASISANASLSSVNPFDINPEVSLAVGLESRVFCMAKLFSKKLEVFNIKLPDVTFFKRSLSMFPNIDEFEAIGGASSAEVGYISSSYYFLQALGVKTGVIVYEQDKTTVVNCLYPPHNRVDKLGNRYYNVNVSGLKSGATYYAAPVISWLGYDWVGELTEFSTEAGYKVMWRCQGREDIWSININVNSNTTELNLPFEAATYNDGWTKRLLVATYDPATGILTGTVETHFYDNPSDRRIDGFSADLKKDDTGYMTNSKVLDNGACYTQIRFVKINGNNTKSVIKELPLGIDECGLGERLMD